MEPGGRQQSTSPKPRTNIAHHGTTKHGDRKPMASSAASQVSQSLTILSSILRAPHPSLSKEQQRFSAPGAMATQPLIRTRGHSPIRVITNMSDAQGQRGHSPSRTPVTLPPKKSISPTRTIYIERKSPSPANQRDSPNRTVSPASSMSQGQGRTATGSLISHLPYLAQTLNQSQPQQQTSAIHDSLFQQYKTQFKTQQEHRRPSGQNIPQGVMIAGRDGINQSSGQPQPAHQSFQRNTSPSQQVSTIRRTPSPAHMAMRSELQGFEAEMKDPENKTKAVNLVKTSGQLHKQEIPLSDSEYRYGDLLQSINKSHETVQSQLLQSGISPITPSDHIPRKIWVQDPNSSQAHVVQSLQSYTVSHPGESVNAKSFGMASSGSGFVPVTSVPAPSLITLPPGFMEGILPTSQGGQRQTSPRSQASPRQSASPKARHPVHMVQTSSHDHQKLVSHFPTSSGVGSIPVSNEGIKAYSRDIGSLSSQISTTQPGPPNITISSSSAIFADAKPIKSQRYMRNPFTFPATPPASLTIERPLVGGVLNFNQSKPSEPEVKVEEKTRHVSGGEMPHLFPVSPVRKDKKTTIKTEEAEEELVTIPQPYNMRFQTLSNFPNNSAYRPTYRATSVAIQKAKIGCITNSAKSLDLLRQNLQKFINKEINAVIQSYLDKFFKVGIENIKLNNGEQSVTEDSVHAVCRQMLEEAKKMYYSDIGRISVSPAREISDNISETGSSGRRSALGRRRHPSDTDSEASTQVKKKKGRPYSNVAGRSTPSKLLSSKREGPKFDPERLTEETLFVMGSRANKAMGFGATRGRLYMKHPDLFKYGGDQDDKTWLYENQHMPATGGKSYILILPDVKELAASDEYKDVSGINVEILKGFSVPKWMIEKMKIQMLAMRTDLPKQAKYRSRSATPIDVNFQQEVEEEVPKDLPFSNFTSPKGKPEMMQASPAEDLDFLKTAAGEVDDPSTGLSPFNMTGGFDDATSQSDLDTIEDETSIEPSFGIDK